MKKTSILVSIGIALFISASVLSGCSDSEKTEIVEKKTVFYKIEEDPKAVAPSPVTESPTQMKKIIEDKPILSQKEMAPPRAITPVEEKVADITPTEEENPEKSNPLENLKKAAPDKKETVAKEETLKAFRFWRYNAADGDTLWDIAKKYYGKGCYYPVLLEHNPHVGIYNVGSGVTLNILKNGENASKIYQKIIIRKDGHFFWRYCVASGDTLQSIVEKYYKKGRSKSDIPNLDKSTELKPGEKIWILIE